MAISVVQTDPSSTTWREATGVTSLTTLGTGSATTTGNRLVMVGWMFDSGGSSVSQPTVSDNGTHSWTNVAYVDENSTPSRFCTYFAYTGSITGRTDHEVTQTHGSTVNMAMGVWEVSGIDATTPVSDSDTGRGGGTSLSLTAALTLSGGEDLVLGMGSHDIGSTSSTWTGATDQWVRDDEVCASKLSSAASESPTWSSTGSANWIASGVAFRPSADIDLWPYAHDGVKPWSSMWRPARI